MGLDRFGSVVKSAGVYGPFGLGNGGFWARIVDFKPKARELPQCPVSNRVSTATIELAHVGMSKLGWDQTFLVLLQRANLKESSDMRVLEATGWF